MPIAILVDGAFFLRRFKSAFPGHNRSDPRSVANGLCLLADFHLRHRFGLNTEAECVSEHSGLAEGREFYRLFFYDCPPLSRRMHTAVTKKAVNFENTPEATFRLALHNEISSLRKAALRLGRLSNTARWRLTERATDRLIKEPAGFAPTDDDFELDTTQKGVDMRLGLDVASLAFKRQVDQIVIVAADADFVPAAKLARREGIDVVLDRMGDSRTASDLIHHVDGIRDCYLPAPPAHPGPAAPD